MSSQLPLWVAFVIQDDGNIGRYSPLFEYIAIIGLHPTTPNISLLVPLLQSCILCTYVGNTSRSQSQSGTHHRNQTHTRTGASSSQTRSTRGGTTSQSGRSRGSTGSAGGSGSFPAHGGGWSNWNDQDFGGQFGPGSGPSSHPFGSHTLTSSGKQQKKWWLRV